MTRERRRHRNGRTSTRRHPLPGPCLCSNCRRHRSPLPRPSRRQVWIVAVGGQAGADSQLTPEPFSVDTMQRWTYSAELRRSGRALAGRSERHAQQEIPSRRHWRIVPGFGGGKRLGASAAERRRRREPEPYGHRGKGGRPAGAAFPGLGPDLVGQSPAGMRCGLDKVCGLAANERGGPADASLDGRRSKRLRGMSP
jgi:hypothetical protein